MTSLKITFQLRNNNIIYTDLEKCFKDLTTTKVFAKNNMINFEK